MQQRCIQNIMRDPFNEQVVGLLKSSGLSVTYSRKLILETFLNANAAISQLKLCKRFNGQLDKATIYRTLRLFVEKKLLQVVPTTDISITYACSANQRPASVTHHDLHFICEKCKKLFPLNEIKLPVISLPQHLSATRSETFIYGICKECNKAGIKDP